jgi:hypothetical protein
MHAIEGVRANIDPLQEERISLVPLLHGAIDALVGNDIEALHRLLRSLGSPDSLTPLPQGTELAEALSLHRRLGALLKETQRNLRLLRRTAGMRTPQSYGFVDF